MMDSSMLKVGGQYFRCVCGANVFHKGVKPGLWICNGCGAEYTDENYDHRKSNADRIRAMSDEKLAIWLAEWSFCADACPASTNEVEEAIGYHCPSNCKEQALTWLQQPAEEETVT